MRQLAFIFLFFSIGVSASEPVPAVIDTVVVYSATTSNLSSSIVLIDPSSSKNISDILDSLPGVQIRKYGNHSELSIRGASAGQLLIAIDGVPLSNAQYGATAITDMSIDRFEKVELFRGSSPAMFGGRGTAGVVNFVSKDSSNNGTSIKLSAGSFGAKSGSAIATSNNCLVSLYANSSDNNYEYLDHNQTFANSSDDTLRNRINAHSEELGGFINITGGDYLISAGVNKKEGGRPGPIGGHQSPNATMENRSADIRMQFELCNSLKVDLIARTAIEKLYDNYGEIGGDPPGTTQSKSGDRVCKISSESYGIEFRNQTFQQQHAGLVDPVRSRESVGLFATKVYNYKKIKVSPIVRWQKLRDEFPPVPPMQYLPPGPTIPRSESDFASTVAINYGSFETHLSSLIRQPNWVELFGHRGGVAGNQALLPEKILTADTGIKKGNYKAMLFATKTDDTIVFLQNSQYTSMARNIGGSRIYGVEFDGRGKIGKLRWNSNLTWQSASDRGDNPVYYDKELPMLPSIQGALKLSTPMLGWQVLSTTEYESASYRNRYNSENELAPDRLLLHLQLKRTWSDRYDWTLAFEAKNLTDNSVYDVEGFPLPGRSFSVSLIVN
jgi:outer membrane receptor protein involved in Fe transport